MTSPADELHTAADKIRKLAADATPGPWSPDSSIPYGHRVGSSDEADWVAWTGEHGAEDGAETDAQYIAAMHPGVGAAIAAWLEREAFRVLQNGRNGELHHALAVARAINDGAQP